MINLIKGDLQRIVRKWSFWFVFILGIIYNVINVVYVMQTGLYNSYTFMNQNVVDIMQDCGFIIGIIIFLAVYADEFKTMTITTVIGEGISRLNVILAKFIDSVILTAGLFILYTIHLPIFNMIAGVTVADDEKKLLYLTVLIGAIYTIGCLAIASMVIYITGSIPFAVMTVVMLYFIIPAVMGLLNYIKILRSFHLERYDLHGITMMGMTDILLGSTFRGIFTLLLGFLIYAVGSQVIAYIVFNKKELDF